MSLQNEYNVLNFVKDLLKADEITHKINKTETFERSCQRKAFEAIVEIRKSEIEHIYQKLLQEQNNKEQV